MKKYHGNFEHDLICKVGCDAKKAKVLLKFENLLKKCATISEIDFLFSGRGSVKIDPNEKHEAG